ncbi:MAG: hypothetical protein MJ182_09985 [Treponema sp.]|nr:hypothetical protein [Treponema sp.]
MNKDWSEKNKEFQKLISKETTFKDGIKVLLEWRALDGDEEKSLKMLEELIIK